MKKRTRRPTTRLLGSFNVHDPMASPFFRHLLAASARRRTRAKSGDWANGTAWIRLYNNES